MNHFMRFPALSVKKGDFIELAVKGQLRVYNQICFITSRDRINYFFIGLYVLKHGKDRQPSKLVVFTHIS